MYESIKFSFDECYIIQPFVFVCGVLNNYSIRLDGKNILRFINDFHNLYMVFMKDVSTANFHVYKSARVHNG